MSVNVLRRISQHHNVKLCDVGQKAHTEHTVPGLMSRARYGA
ncbi:hypothetical protein ACIF85_47775 [Streptomyces sp. NPDC086033]|nr:hypothetical protein [Streptomyces sp. LUP47B]